MKLLFLAHRIPFPPNKGDKIRAFHEIEGLRAAGHEIHLAAFADHRSDYRYAGDLRRLCASVAIVPLDRRVATLRSLAGAASGRSLTLAFFSSARMRREVSSIVSGVRPDAIFVYCSAMVQYVPEAYVARTVVDFVDVDSEKWREYAEAARGPRSWLCGLEWRRLRAYERSVVDRFADTIVTTEREAAFLRTPDGAKGLRLRAIVNGVNTDHFRPADAAPSSDSATGRVTFVGAMDYYPNIDAVCHFADAALPLVRARHPRVEFVIVGSRPVRRVQRLAGRPGIVVTGHVSDVRQHLHAATVCVAPLRIARGVQNKVLEAMACGRAVVATPQAIAGLGVVAGRDVLVAADAQAFADATATALGDRDLRARLGASARRFVERHHKWSDAQAEVVKLVEQLAV